MKITLWGTRGSLAAPGPETVRYGGNTACVEVRGGDDSLLILDAGTGIRRLGGTVESEVRRIDVLLTHLHMDHIQGLGFFTPLDQPGRDVHIWAPPSTTPRSSASASGGSRSRPASSATRARPSATGSARTARRWPTCPTTSPPSAPPASRRSRTGHRGSSWRRARTC